VNRILRRGRERIKKWARYIYAWASFLYSFARCRTTYVTHQWPGTVELTEATRVAVFVHFDRRGIVHEFVHYYLEEIARTGFVIVFVTNGPPLSRTDLERVARVCGVVLRRQNVGRDFGAFKDGIAAIPDLARLEALLLADDSVYGPFHDLGDVIGRMPMAEADVWGITDSWDQSFHLQSFFLLFGRRALASAAFGRFWRQVRYVQSKSWIISHHEVGLTRALTAAGLRCRALCPYREAATALMSTLVRQTDGTESPDVSPTRRAYAATVIDAVSFGKPLNSSHFFWDHLVLTMRCPFIKRELLRDNPVNVPGLIRWQEVIQTVSKYDTDLIARHLERSVRNRAV
jgi:lipopolysaccharide biosynthesis protein